MTRASIAFPVELSRIMFVISTFLCLLLVWYFSSLPRYYRLARATGLPIFISPVNPANPFWLVFSSTFEPTLSRYLPQLIYDRIKVSIFGWEYRCRYAVNDNLGPVFVLVTPSSNEIWIADPDMATSVLLRKNDFLQLELASRMSLFIVIVNAGHYDCKRRIIRLIYSFFRHHGDVWAQSGFGTVGFS